MNAPTSLLPMVEADPTMVLTDGAKFAAFVEAVRQESAKAGTDVSTAKGRDAIKSAAYKIVRSKTAIDAAGKALNESAREQINKVDAARREIREKLDALAAEVRQPLTDWETAEKAREDAAEALFTRLKAAAVVGLDDTSAGVTERLAELGAIAIDAETYGDFAEAAREALTKTTADLAVAVERLTRAEAERAELEQMRAAEAQRQAQAEAARLEAERQEQEREAAAERERQAEAARAAEAERVAQAAETARLEAVAEAERQLAAAEEKAAAERRTLEEAHAEELRRVEQAAQAERDRAAAEAKRKADEEAATARAEVAHQADRDHRSQVMGAAKTALMEIEGVGEFEAVAIVRAIVAGAIPAVTLQF